MAKSNITLYACGGAGLNIASVFEAKASSEPDVGFAAVNPIYIDTSRANLKAHGNDRTYILQDVDGSGKLRSENHQQIADCVLDILHKHKPGDLAVVLSSAGGGSGSVLAPSLVNELVNRNQPLIVIAIGSTDSRIEIENTVKTLKSYENIAQRSGVPITMLYAENVSGKKRTDVDNQIQQDLIKLAALFSGQNTELDKSDLRNWLNYTKVTSYQSHLVALDFFQGSITAPKNGTVISVATIAPEHGSTSAGQVVEYQCVGFLPTTGSNNLSLNEALHFTLIDGVFVDIIKDLQKTLNELEEVKKSALKRTNILGNDDNATSAGIIL